MNENKRLQRLRPTTRTRRRHGMIAGTVGLLLAAGAVAPMSAAAATPPTSGGAGVTAAGVTAVQAEEAPSTGSGSASGPASQALGPKPVANPKVTPGDGSLVVSWEAPDSPAGPNNLYYKVWFAGQSCSTQALSCTFTGLENGTQYDVRIQVFHNGWGNSDTLTVRGIPQAANAGDVSWKGGGAYLAAQPVLGGDVASSTRPVIPVDLTVRAGATDTTPWTATLQHYRDGVAVGAPIEVEGKGAFSGTFDVPLDPSTASGTHEVRATVTGNGRHTVSSGFQLPDLTQADTTTTVTAAYEGGATRIAGNVTTSSGPARGEVQLYVTEPGKAPVQVHGPQLVLDASGSFTESLEDDFPEGSTVRVVYPGSWTAASSQAVAGIATSTPTQPNATPSGSSAASVAPKASTKVKAVSSASKLHVDVNPNVGKESWSVKVQKKGAGGTWKDVKTVTTKGAAETATVNLPKGTYRVVVPADHGFETTTSKSVTLKR